MAARKSPGGRFGERSFKALHYYNQSGVLKMLVSIRPIYLLAAILLAKSSLANMSDPPSPRAGNITGDSYFKQLSVLREELVINMSEIDKGRPVKVSAKYVIDCPKLLTNIDLVFVANGLTESRYRVDLDGRFVNGYLTPFDSIPSSWLPPDSVQWMEGKIPFLYEQEGLISFRFDTLTPGHHSIIVNYDAEASSWFSKDDLSTIRTFVYILKPSENWKSFKNFYLVVFHPDNWELSSNLQLQRATSYSLSGDWEVLPDQYISLAIRKPPSPALVKSILFQSLSWIAFISLMIFWMAKVTRYRIVNRKSRTLQVLNSILVSLLASIFFFFLYFKNHDLLNAWLDNHLNPLITYGTGYFVFTFPVIWIAAGIITFVADYFLEKRIATRCKKTKHGLAQKTVQHADV